MDMAFDQTPPRTPERQKLHPLRSHPPSPRTPQLSESHYGLQEILRAHLGGDGIVEESPFVNEVAATAATVTEAINSTEAVNSTDNDIPQELSDSDDADAVSLTASDTDQPLTVGTKKDVADDGKSVKDTERKCEKKKNEDEDPTTTKKPLTAALLYAQTTRSIVEGDMEAAPSPDQKLGSSAANMEVNKRWNEMPEEDKEIKEQLYHDPMDQWKEEMATYQASEASANVSTRSLEPNLHEQTPPPSSKRRKLVLLRLPEPYELFSDKLPKSPLLDALKKHVSMPHLEHYASRVLGELKARNPVNHHKLVSSSFPESPTLTELRRNVSTTHSEHDVFIVTPELEKPKPTNNIDGEERKNRFERESSIDRD